MGKTAQLNFRLVTSDKNECIELSREMTDRFGLQPEPVKKLMALLEIRVFCQKLHISQIHVKNGKVILALLPSTPIKTENLVEILDERLKIFSEFQMRILLDRKGWRADLNMIVEYLQKILKSLDIEKVVS